MSVESGSPDPDPSCPPLHPPTDEQVTFESSTSGSQPSETEGKSRESESSPREDTDGSAQMMENTRKRKRCSKDSTQVKMENEGTSHSEERQKTPAKNTEPEANGHPGGLARCPEPPHTSPPPLRKSLVLSLRAMSEAVCGDIAQLQAQQRHFLLTQEQLSKLTQLSGSLSAMVQTFYSLANQASFAFPAEGWLVPALMADPQELTGNDSRSSSLEEGQITDTASPSDKS
ncbi:protein FRG2-like-1 [Peromyscus californicus insignis]|uniref:protein FRG2-like-1 n=1 Tax=Peromyscus californicus insignis TaxID=564181 RepID=UPI0022A6A390|nr:protein FRG2-like-1 [Peromyscus californicus insignis]